MKKIRFFIYFLLIGLILTITVEIIRFRHVIFPKHDFKYSYQSENLNLYSDASLDSLQLQPFHQTTKFLKNHPLYRIENNYDIFLCTRQDNYSRIATKIKKGKMTQGLHIEPIDYNFLNLTFIQEVNQKTRDAFSNTLLAGDTSHVLLHEITHGLLADFSGWWSIRKIPNWKLEGYCEYAATFSVEGMDTNKHYEKLMQNYLYGEMDQVASGRILYIRASLITWYCMEIEGMPLESFLSDNRPEAMMFQKSQEYWTSLQLQQ